MTDTDTNHASLKAEIAQFQVAGAPKPHVNFAQAWPAAREVLTLLSTLVPASLRMILTIVLSVGDTVAGTSAVKPA